MEVQFDKIPVPYLQKLLRQPRSQEQTLEVRLPEELPDIGHVLGAWGQVIVRSKEWNADQMGVSCGVMAWVLYTPEDGDGIYSVEAWLPFSMKWDLPDVHQDGKILTSCLLQSVDARSTSARKLMVRATLNAMGEAWLPGEAQLSVPDVLPEDVERLSASYPVLLPKEAGEKPFQLEEELNLPVSGPKPEKLMYYCLQPEIVDQKVMAGKVVFRGNGALHVLYRADDGRVYSWDHDIPFSQYGDLEEAYDQEPTVTVRPCVTSLDLTLGEEGVLQLRAGILGQYLLCDRTVLTVTEDAYSPCRAVTLEKEMLQLPTVLDRTIQNIRAESTAQADAQQIVDVSFYPVCGQTRHAEDMVSNQMSGQFQMLYYDPEGTLCGTTAQWEGAWDLPADGDSVVDMYIGCFGKLQAIAGAGSVNFRAEMSAEAVSYCGRGIPIVTGLDVAEEQKPDPNRPSLILCKKGRRRLWDVAKESGSTVETIMKANHLDTEPEDSRVLLIPLS